MVQRTAILLLLAFLATDTARADDFPYIAYINSDDVYVRSGPGRDYYPTTKLSKGKPVEVYRHDPGGWLAIRPPAGSYCWVSARHLDPTEGELATVNSERVVARVGSEFSDVRDVIQVRLERDEEVVLIEPPASDSPWCKIEPPAGEFRWVFAQYVGRAPHTDDHRSARDEDVATSSRLTSFVPAARAEQTTPDPQALAALQNELERVTTLEQIDVELSQILAEDISQWSFNALEQRAQQALQTSETALERGRARVLLDKLARFEEIKQRHDALSVGASGGAVASAGRQTAAPASNGRFDGVGRLAPVLANRPGGPQYALLDERGSVRSYVTPAPGVNLRPFVDQNVGVSGQRGYIPDLQKQHVSAQRITLLDTTRR
jgi:uncharacterized protein YgiM (DUF1202 family)